MKDGESTAICAIFALALMECVALYQGIDGWLFGIVVAAIAGLGGYKIRGVRLRIEHEGENAELAKTESSVSALDRGDRTSLSE